MTELGGAASAGSRVGVWIALALVVVALVLAGLAPDALSQSSEEPPYDPNQILVKPKAGATEEDIMQVEGINGPASEEAIPGTSIQVAEIPEGSTVEETVGLYEASPDVEIATPDTKMYLEQSAPSPAPVFPDDPDFGLLHGLHNTGETGGTLDADIDAPEAWSVTTGAPRAVVAVVDQGVNIDHPDLDGNVWTNPDEVPDNGVDDDNNGYVDDVHGWDFVNKDNTLYDQEDEDYEKSHGTHVAGIVAAEGNNGLGGVGVAHGARIMPLKVSSPTGISASRVIAALRYASGEGVRISNNSYGCLQSTPTSPCYNSLLAEEIRKADAAGHLFVSSSGNEAKDTDVTAHYPSGYDSPNVVSVASTDENDRLGVGSNYGAASVDLAAPGTNIWSTTPDFFFDYRSGTSMAAAHVAGVAALVKSQSPDLGHLQVKERILQGADEKDALKGRTASGGRLNAAGALGILGPQPPDADAPTVIAVSPPEEGEGSAAVSPGANVEATFSEAMDPGTVNGETFWLSLWDGGYPKSVPATVRYDATTRKAVLDPEADLKPEPAYYTATVLGDANGVKDLAGNALVADKTWSFTTAAPDTAAPNTTITSERGGTAAEKPVTFGFSSSEPDSTFLCRIDWETTHPDLNAPLPPFEPCSSPKTYPVLGEGLHTFEVKAKDAAGNIDPTPASRTIYVDTVPPTASAPARSFVVPSSMTEITAGYTMPVKISWTGQDQMDGMSNGVSQYELQRSVNGGAWSGDLLQQAPISPAMGAQVNYATFSHALSTSYKFRVRAKDATGNWGPWTEGTAFTPRATDQGAAAITYPTGAWSTVEFTGAYGGLVRHASAAGAKARFTFTGRGVAWVAPKAASRGYAEVWVDGAKVATVNSYSDTHQRRQVLFQRSWGSSGTHTVEVRVLGTKNAAATGTRVDVDAFLTFE